MKLPFSLSIWFSVPTFLVVVGFGGGFFAISESVLFSLLSINSFAGELGIEEGIRIDTPSRVLSVCICIMFCV